MILNNDPMMLPELPAPDLDDVTIPAVVSELAAGRPVRPVSCNEAGVVTFTIGDGAEFIAHGRPSREFRPADEAARLTWVSAYVTVPSVLGHGEDVDGFRWLHLTGLPGVPAVAARWRQRPEIAVPELGAALRRFHDRVPVAHCPWEWAITGRVAQLPNGAYAFNCWPALDEVVCHGDARSTNILLDPDGRCIGYIGLGRLGIGDRWADLAPAIDSLSWTFGDGWQEAFLAGYGIALDARKLEFYTRLWQAAD